MAKEKNGERSALRRTKGPGSVFRDANSVWHYRMAMPADPVTGKRRIIEAKGKVKSETCARFEAKLAEYERLGRIPSKNSPYLRDWLERWLTDIASRIKPRVFETYRSECHAIAGAIGVVRLERLAPEHVRLMLDTLAPGRSGKTLADYRIRLRQALAAAMREGLIQSNPVDLTEPPRIEPPRIEPNDTAILAPGQPIDAIKAAEVDDPDGMWRLMFRLTFATGMRQAERFAVAPEQLITRNGIHGIQVDRELQHYNGDNTPPEWLRARQLTPHMWIAPPKSRKSIRFVPIDTTLWLDLKTWATEHRIPDGQPIFTRKGHTLTNPVERRLWIKALQAAGLPYVTIRSARHFYATQLAAGGASEDARKAIIGHTKISVTAGYTHWRPEDLAALAGEARAAIGESAVV